ncbi:hypothetical protein LRAMOSA08400 [Lichtheimia ramosa]|uniref:Uncharacterized protein n=1 Tax=Lichtheimia ramosa TaxID=688394 RepID=A0A077WGT7_9FUNG|nr:hypothetical protein LRAMOSA08400 [Lichtheimia ramosa]
MDGPAMMLHYLIDDSANVGLSTYVLVTIAGTGVQSHLASLQQKLGKADKAASHEKLHFSVCKSDGNWSAEQVKCLAEEVKDMLQKHQAATEGDSIQVLGVRPKDKNRLTYIYRDPSTWFTRPQ